MSSHLRCWSLHHLIRNVVDVDAASVVNAHFLMSDVQAVIAQPSVVAARFAALRE